MKFSPSVFSFFAATTDDIAYSLWHVALGVEERFRLLTENRKSGRKLLMRIDKRSRIVKIEGPKRPGLAAAHWPPYLFIQTLSLYNKKVLLHERKRHTARPVASARYADLSGGGRYPISGLGGDTLSHVRGVVPHPRSGGGVPGVPPNHLDLAGVPLPLTWPGYPSTHQT